MDGDCASTSPSSTSNLGIAVIDGDAFGTALGCTGRLVGFFIEASRQKDNNLRVHEGRVPVLAIEDR